MTKVITEIPEVRDRRWKAWRRIVESVDTSKTNGWAFRGEFIKAGRKAELEVGTIVMIYDEVGSRSSHEPVVSVCRVNNTGGLDELLSARGWDWALELRDQVVGLLADKSGELEVLRAEAEALRARLAEIEAKIAELEAGK